MAYGGNQGLAGLRSRGILGRGVERIWCLSNWEGGEARVRGGGEIKGLLVYLFISFSEVYGPERFAGLERNFSEAVVAREIRGVGLAG